MAGASRGWEFSLFPHKKSKKKPGFHINIKVSLQREAVLGEGLWLPGLRNGAGVLLSPVPALRAEAGDPGTALPLASRPASPLLPAEDTQTHSSWPPCSSAPGLSLPHASLLLLPVLLTPVLPLSLDGHS